MSDLIERAKAALAGWDRVKADLADFDGDRRGHLAALTDYAERLNGKTARDLARALIDTTAERNHLQAKVNGMQALCDDLVGEVEKAVAERTEELRDQVRRYGDQIDTLTAERDALRERVAKLEAALRPFANYAAHGKGSDLVPDNHALTQGSRFAARQITMGDMRNARAALQEAPPNG